MAKAPKPVSGTRDFTPEQVRKRRWLFATLQEVFERYGYQPIETPSMERLDVLTGKYGEEGDQLLFKVLNNGDFWSKVNANGPLESAALLPQLSERALRYDLTVPFTRYLVNHRNDIQLPFKRYQMQPVWRADRPQKGRYREFWQCDCDAVGSASLALEAELLQLYAEGFTALGLPAVTLKLNHRKALEALATHIGASNRFTDLCVALDKLDKIGWDGVSKELLVRGLSEAQTLQLQGFELTRLSLSDLLTNPPSFMGNELGKAALADLSSLASLLGTSPLPTGELEIDLTLARGLDYYTGFIFEVDYPQAGIGSLGGGGRYDNLAGIFGWPELTGVGISFGADRIYDVLEAEGLFPDHLQSSLTQVLVLNFGGKSEPFAFHFTQQLRQEGIRAEFYPDAKKPGKQFAYADKRGIRYAVILGDEEMASGTTSLKDLQTGEQQALPFVDIVKRIQQDTAAA